MLNLFQHPWILNQVQNDILPVMNSKYQITKLGYKMN